MECEGNIVGFLNGDKAQKKSGRFQEQNKKEKTEQERRVEQKIYYIKSVGLLMLLAWPMKCLIVDTMFGGISSAMIPSVSLSLGPSTNLKTPSIPALAQLPLPPLLGTDTTIT